MIQKIVFVIFGVLFILYGLFILGARSGTSFWLTWEALGGICLLAAFLLHTGFFARHKAVGITAAVLAAAFLLLIGVLSAKIVTAFTAKSQPGLDYLIVLGAQVRYNGPSALLISRLDTAADYLSANENTVCIVSGGKGANEPAAEADVMYDYLVKCGIKESRILRENRSKNTAENIRFSKELLPENYGSVGVVTNDFHVLRAVKLAEGGGLMNVTGMSAPSVPAYLPNNIFRECLALIKDCFAGNL